MDCGGLTPLWLDGSPATQGVKPPRWSVRMDLWTAEEGRSDLSLELTIIESGRGYTVELDDIHVL